MALVEETETNLSLNLFANSSIHRGNQKLHINQKIGDRKVWMALVRIYAATFWQPGMVWAQEVIKCQFK